MKKVVLILLSMIMFAIPVRAYEAIVVMDADSKRVLYDVNANSKYLIASTTKIMTALVAINYGKLDEIVTAGDEIMDAYGSSIYLKPQERMSLRDLIYGLLLRSGNDAALTIAVNVAGSVEGFVKLMNDTALGIGMHDTVFENPHGLDEKTENKSTVYDMALLMVEAMKSPEFRNITSAKKYDVESNF
ncbi:MAG TPA: D-alanyl-D-alanine carboxypeptidase, partial [Firmicutes bacterium]|nr:D-alanyl-D-alanine carboxypeptidase [Bacillota bacterium]